MEVRDGYFVLRRGERSAATRATWATIRHGGYLIRVFPKQKYATLEIDYEPPAPEIDFWAIAKPYFTRRGMWGAHGHGLYLHGPLLISEAIEIAEQCVQAIKATRCCASHPAPA